MPHVLLLRSPSQDTPDPYEDAFQTQGYLVDSLQVLETTHTNLDDLRQAVRTGPDFAGVIITSGRAAEAWRIVISEAGDVVEDNIQYSAPVSWAHIPFYVVGETTASLLREIFTAYPSAFAPKIIRGADSGGDERLAHFILDDLSHTEGAKLLYLTGDKNRDTLPNILGDAGLELVTLQVYETRGSSSFEENLREKLEGVKDSRHLDNCWIAFFAPSAADFAFPKLQNHFRFRRIEGNWETVASSSQLPHRPAKIAAIGPTTAAFLRDSLQLHVDVVSSKPGAQSLARVITEYDQRDSV